MGSDDDVASWGAGGFFGNRILGSLFLMIAPPVFLMTFVHICTKQDGSFEKFADYVKTHNALDVFYEIVPSPFQWRVWKVILSYMAFELFLMRFVPGKIFKATVTPTGHTPVYIANGFQSYLISIGTLLLLARYNIFNPSWVYDNMSDFLSSMNVFAIGLCCFLTFKGLNFPSTKDNGTNGSIIVDFFWGTELYPRVFGFDIKQFTNCRFGMMFWQLGLICYAFKQYELYGFVSSSMVASLVLQSIYIAKFFYWETGYFCSMDIQHDRAGYYLCWGCCCWVPSMYTIHTFFLTTHPVLLSFPTTIFFLVAGTFCIWCNYDCDRQRQDFRATGGKLKVWGKAPDFLVAKYTTKDGEERSSTLLASGWWGLSRHFHYIPEISAAFFWCAPGLFEYPLPFFYPVYLTILLFDRAWRDDKRCADKYGKYWDMYCTKVPYKIIPGVV